MVARGEKTVLDDLKKIAEVDKQDMLGFIAKQPKQLEHDFGIAKMELEESPTYNVVFCGMGGSSLVAELATTWPEMGEPFVISKGYDVPSWVDQDTLVVVSSYSGNTEETLSAYQQAKDSGAKIAVIAHGGKLAEIARSDEQVFAEIPKCVQPRASVFYMYRALVEILVAHGLVEPGEITKLAGLSTKLANAAAAWASDMPESKNQAKQLAKHMVGKTPIFYGGPFTAPAAYKWKIGCNENAKNTAWCNEYPEFNHNEFIGWSSHPVDKPFAVIDLISSFEHERVLERFKLSDKLLSGKRPKAVEVEAVGESVLEQLLYLVLLGDMATTYLGVLNNVDPSPVELVEKFKKELS